MKSAKDTRTYSDRRDYMRIYRNRWMKNRRLKWLLDNGPCKQCGSTENLEVDHILRETKIEHKIWSWKQSRREVELKKCQVLCKKCHAKKSSFEKTQIHTPQKLTEKCVQTIRIEALAGNSSIDLAKKFKVHKSTIYKIIRREIWKHI